MTFTHFMPHWPKEDKCFEDEQVKLQIGKERKPLDHTCMTNPCDR